MARPYNRSGKYIGRAAKNAATKERPTPDPAAMTYSEICDALNVSVRTIKNYVEGGMPSRMDGRNRLFDHAACVAWVRAYHATLPALNASALTHVDLSLPGDPAPMGGVDRQSPMGETARVKLFLETEKIATYLSIQRRDLIPREEVEADYRATLGVLRQQLLGLGASIARTLGLDHEKQREVEKLVRGFMESLQTTIADESLRPAENEFDIPPGLLTGVLGLLKSGGAHVA